MSQNPVGLGVFRAIDRAGAFVALYQSFETGGRVIDRAGWSVLGRACGLVGTLLPLSPGEGRIWVLRVVVISTVPVTCSVGLASVCGGGALLVVQWSSGLVVWWSGGPKCVWVSLFSACSARGWSEMRLGLVVLAGFGWIRWDSDAFWTTCPPSPRSRPRLRRFLDHSRPPPPGFAVEPEGVGAPNVQRAGVRPHWGGLRCIGAGY